MGLLYTKLYLDFDSSVWKEISKNPIIFEAKKENVSLEVYDTSQKSNILKFKKGGKVHFFRVVGRFRITWDEDDLVH
jgi:hypothetical protein